MPIRNFTIVADEPASAGGDDLGPTPTELFLASLATCFTMAVAFAARKRDTTLEEITVRIKADYEGMQFSWIRLEVGTDLGRHATQDLVERAQQYCFVSRTLTEPPDMEYVAVE